MPNGTLPLKNDSGTHAMRKDQDRRQFIQQSGSAVTAAAVTLGGVHTLAQEKPTKLNLGIIGCGGIMTHHVKGLSTRRGEVSIAWLCDVDPGQMNKIASPIKNLQSKGPKRTGHYEDVIADRNVDAVIIAGEREAFALGQDLLAKLTAGRLYLCVAPGADIPAGSAANIETAISDLKEALEGEDTDAITAKSAALWRAALWPD